MGKSERRPPIVLARVSPNIGDMISELLFPVLELMLMAILVTRGIELVTPESLQGLALLTLISAVLCWALASAGFALLYWRENPGVLTVMGQDPSASLSHFLWLGGSAALIWAPVLLLTVSTAPRRWKTAVW